MMVAVIDWRIARVGLPRDAIANDEAATMDCRS